MASSPYKNNWPWSTSSFWVLSAWDCMISAPRQNWRACCFAREERKNPAIFFFFLNKLTVFSKGSSQLLFTNPQQSGSSLYWNREQIALTGWVTQGPTVLHHTQASRRMIEQYLPLLVLQPASHGPHNERKSIRGPPRMLFCSLGAQFAGLILCSGTLHILICNRPSHTILHSEHFDKSISP